MNKLVKYLNVINFILWTGSFLAVIFLNLNANDLKKIAIGAMFVIVIDLFFDMLGNRDKRIRRKITLEHMSNEFNRGK